MTGPRREAERRWGEVIVLPTVAEAINPVKDTATETGTDPLVAMLAELEVADREYDAAWAARRRENAPDNSATPTKYQRATSGTLLRLYIALKAIATTPATTLEGVGVKLHVYLKYQPDPGAGYGADLMRTYREGVTRLVEGAKS